MIIVLGKEEEVRGRANSAGPANSALNEWESSEKENEHSFFRQLITVIRMAIIATLEMQIY